MKKIFETGIILFAAFGFWGMIYPDLCFTEEVCRVIVYDKTYIAADENINERDDIYTRICEAQPEEIVIRSKLLDVLGFGKEDTEDTEAASADVKESKGKGNAENKYGEESGVK